MQEFPVKFYQINDRVRINLSNLAHKVIFESDLRIFEDSADDHWTQNHFINMLIQNFEGDFALNTDLLNYKDGNYYLARLNTKTLKMINSWDRHYQQNIELTGAAEIKKFECSQFIKCLLETYARLPFIEREKLILKNSVIKPIEAAISEGRKLSVIYAFEDMYTVSPICIAPAKEGTFQYLVCIHEDGRIESLRLSRIKEVHKLKTKSTPLPEHRIKEITEDLAEFGPTFIKEKKVTVKVRLTQQGILSYMYSVIHRPMHIDVEYESDGKDADILVFRCSEMQAIYFFFRFAGKAEILEPQSLRDTFRQLYSEGLKNYM